MTGVSDPPNFLQELTFVYSFFLITVFDEPRYAIKFSCKSAPKFTAQPRFEFTSPYQAHRWYQYDFTAMARPLHIERLRGRVGGA